MAPKPVTIEFVAEVASYLRSVKKVEVSTDDIADALVAVSKDSKGLEKDLARAMRESSRDTDRLARVVDELGDKIEDTGDASKKAAKKMKDGFGRLKGDFGEIGTEASSELKQNLSEGLSSGNLEDTVQSTLGGLVSGLSGVMGGVVAGLAGIGALAFQQMRENAELEMAALVSIGDATLTRMQEITSSILTQRDAAVILNQAVQENPEHWMKVKAAAEAAGLDWVQVVTDIIEGGSKAEAVYDELRDIMSDDIIYTSAKEGTNALGEQGEAASKLTGLLQEVGGEVQDTVAEYELLNDVAAPLVNITDQMRRNLQGAKDAARGLRGELPYSGGNRPT